MYIYVYICMVFTTVLEAAIESQDLNPQPLDYVQML